MKLRTLGAIILIAHALAHPAVHTLSLLSAAQELVQPPASGEPAGPQVARSALCPACLGQRGMLAISPLLLATHWEWQQLVPPALTPALFFPVRTLPARAPPA